MREKLGNKIVVIMSFVCIIALIAVGVLSVKLIEAKKEPTVTTSVITSQLQNMSDLTTSQLQYRGMIRYEEGTITFINKKSYTMLYDASVKAGIDMEQAKIQVTGKKVKVTLPKAKIQEIVINPDTLEFYDEKNSLFNWDDKQDTVKALQLAKEDATARIDETELLKQAEQQAELLIKNLVYPMTVNGNYEVEITFS
ncbi:MAG TPA: DUF4230 domain-containing protein [Lachnospiraceae bacterium]|nr:DUF4230 domain-containing protein [Lachnospiraceae bacterium]HIS61681.1 DUF4230 domain-containing protein [Candidatus Scybalomonas excrementigallinarum]